MGKEVMYIKGKNRASGIKPFTFTMKFTPTQLTGSVILKRLSHHKLIFLGQDQTKLQEVYILSHTDTGVAT